MDLHTELTRLNASDELTEWVVGTVQKLVSQAQKGATELHAANIKNQALVIEIAHLRRMRFGATSEALSSEQRDLFAETLAADVVAIEDELAAQTNTATSRPVRERAGRQTLPDHLPRIDHLHEPESCTCAKCGGDLVKIRDDISEQLDVTPAKFFVHRHIRPQYACRPCETITAAPIPAAVIDGGMAAVGLYAWVITSKYLDHLPLYRLEQIAARDKVMLSRKTMSEWVGRIGVALQPLADRLAELLRQRSVLHADETPVGQLDPGGGKTKRGYLWVYRTGELGGLESGPPIALFDYQPGRGGEHARRFLDGWHGSLMVDDYGGYKKLFSEHNITELACLAHIRRKFFDLDAAADKKHPNRVAQEALTRIAALYAIEATCKTMSIDERTQARQTDAAPLLQSMRDWLLTTRVTIADGGATAKAIDYSLRRWPALIRYATDGQLPIDNNPVENTIRPIAIGKKNWLFVGSERAGKRAAAIQTLLATAKLNGLDPAAWLRETLEQLPTCRNNNLDSLLPFRAEEMQQGNC